MPELPASARVARLTLFTSALASRGFEATATVEETPEGGSVSITIVQTSGGVGPPDVPDTLELSIRIDNGATIVKTFPLTPASASQTVTFHFTDTGNLGGSPRHETYRLRLRAARTGGTAATNYDANSDSGFTVTPAGYTADWNRGWIIGTTTAVVSLSNVAVGGAKNLPAEYDESLFHRVTLGSPSHSARALTHTLDILSGTSAATTSATHDHTFANVVDDRFPAAVTTLTGDLTLPNATLSGKAYTTLTSKTTDTINVDPRLTVGSKLWQADDDIIGTPPMSKHDSSKAALVSSYSGWAGRIVTARTQSGVNGLSYSGSMDPQNPGGVKTFTGTTATRGGDAGWTDLMQLGPFVIGGGWDVALDITAPADIDNNAHLVSSTDVVTILAPDPRFGVFLSLVPLTASEDDHLHAGDDMRLVATPFNRDSRRRITADAGTVQGTIVRYRRDLSRFEYLSSANVWTHWSGTTTVADGLALTDSGDGVTWVKDFLSTNGWGASDIVGAMVAFKVGGTPYGFYVPRELVGPHSSHAVPNTLDSLADVNTAGAVEGESLVLFGTEWQPSFVGTNNLDGYVT